MAKVTIEIEGVKVSIEVEKEDVNIYEIFEEMIIPALLSAGYNQETIDSYLES